MTLRIAAPDIFLGDAVGNHCIGIARMAARIGLPAALYAKDCDIGSIDVRALETLFDDVTRDDIVLLSYSIFDANLERFLALDCRKVCYFHGVTDPHLLAALEPRTAELCAKAIAQLPLLAGFDVVIANSRQTAHSLAAVLPADAVKVIPPVFADMPAFRHDVLHETQRSRKSRHQRETNLLMVGRVVPHKRIEDGIDLVALLRNTHGINTTLSVVGSTPNYDYLKQLINHARGLGVLEQVDFKGMLDDADLFDSYASATALLAMSRHEGFCVPVLEAMHWGKAVFVRGGTAAEEIAPSGFVFDADADLANTWAPAITLHLAKHAGQGAIDPAFQRHAEAVLQLAGDEAWRNALPRAQ